MSQRKSSIPTLKSPKDHKHIVAILFIIFLYALAEMISYLFEKSNKHCLPEIIVVESLYDLLNIDIWSTWTFPLAVELNLAHARQYSSKLGIALT